MERASKKMDMEKLMIYGDNLMEFLREDKDTVALMHILRQSDALQSQCLKDFNDVKKSIEDYEKKIDVCRQKAAAVAESESATDAELGTLQNPLEKEQELERMLNEELRFIVNEIDDLEDQRFSNEEQMHTFKKLEQDEIRAQFYLRPFYLIKRMKLSMHASVTNIIPDFNDPSTISGHIVDRDNKTVKKFELNPSETTSFDACNHMWKIINLG